MERRALALAEAPPCSPPPCRSSLTACGRQLRPSAGPCAGSFGPRAFRAYVAFTLLEMLETSPSVASIITDHTLVERDDWLSAYPAQDAAHPAKLSPVTTPGTDGLTDALLTAF